MTTHKTKERIGTVFDLTNVKEALRKERQKGIKQGEKQERERILGIIRDRLKWMRAKEYKQNIPFEYSLNRSRRNELVLIIQQITSPPKEEKKE